MKHSVAVAPCRNILFKLRATSAETMIERKKRTFALVFSTNGLAKPWCQTPIVRIMERTNQFVGSSLAFLDAVERASRAAPLNRPVLVIGERGTGKELIAERLHHLSGRWAGPLVTMNCAALPENLIEAELFGHEAGSFTGAVKTRHGRFEEADGGTLFLDELASLSSPAQDRLLRAVEYGEITRIGASRPIQVDVRIVAATNEHLPRLVDEGRFRADLLDRLSFEVVTLPPLRARSGDIPLLAEHFGRRMAVELEWSNWPGFSQRIKDQLETYPWPGNVRELRNTIERLLILSSGPRITADDVERLAGRRGDSGDAGLGSLLEVPTFEEFKHAAERAYLVVKLREYDWNVSETARGLDMPRSNLYKKIERYGLNREGGAPPLDAPVDEADAAAEGDE